MNHQVNQVRALYFLTKSTKKDTYVILCTRRRVSGKCGVLATHVFGLGQAKGRPIRRSILELKEVRAWLLEWKPHPALWGLLLSGGKIDLRSPRPQLVKGWPVQFHLIHGAACQYFAFLWRILKSAVKKNQTSSTYRGVGRGNMGWGGLGWAGLEGLGLGLLQQLRGPSRALRHEEQRGVGLGAQLQPAPDFAGLKTFFPPS